MSRAARNKLWAWSATLMIVIAGIAALNWRSLQFGLAALLSERRPALLDDARWGVRSVPSRQFADRFAAGTSERQLLVWLAENKFDVDRSNRRASRMLSGFPCAELVDITWSTSTGELLESAEATVSGSCV